MGDAHGRGGARREQGVGGVEGAVGALGLGAGDGERERGELGGAGPRAAPFSSLAS